MGCPGLRNKDKRVHPSPRRRRRKWMEKRKPGLRQQQKDATTSVNILRT